MDSGIPESAGDEDHPVGRRAFIRRTGHWGKIPGSPALFRLPSKPDQNQEKYQGPDFRFISPLLTFAAENERAVVLLYKSLKEYVWTA